MSMKGFHSHQTLLQNRHLDSDLCTDLSHEIDLKIIIHEHIYYTAGQSGHRYK